MGRRHRGDIECVRETLTEAELSRYQFLRSITDSRRLKEMLPGWCRPKPIPRCAEFVPGLPARFPSWCKVSIGMRDIPREEKMFPGYAYYDNDGDGDPGGLRVPTPREYVKAFDKLNGLKPCPIELVKVQSFG